MKKKKQKNEGKKFNVFLILLSMINLQRKKKAINSILYST